MNMYKRIKQRIKNIIRYDDKIRIQWKKTSSQGELFKHYPFKNYKPYHKRIYETIEENVRLTGEKGNLPLWDGYDHLNDYRPHEGKQRNVYQVRSSATICKFYTELVSKIKPETIIEIGGAFGVSGMYWLAGIKMNNAGFLYSFEPNKIWSSIANQNLASIDHRFNLVNATFEEQCQNILNNVKCFQVAFIDAIHTSKFVFNQYELLKNYARSGTVILLDDINFSRDMQVCWESISKKDEVLSSFQINNRVGVIELR